MATLFLICSLIGGLVLMFAEMKAYNAITLIVKLVFRATGLVTAAGSLLYLFKHLL